MARGRRRRKNRGGKPSFEELRDSWMGLVRGLESAFTASDDDWPNLTLFMDWSPLFQGTIVAEIPVEEALKEYLAEVVLPNVVSGQQAKLVGLAYSVWCAVEGVSGEEALRSEALIFLVMSPDRGECFKADITRSAAAPPRLGEWKAMPAAEGLFVDSIRLALAVDDLFDEDGGRQAA